ncbi:MAG: nitroreductase family protein, partial [Deltaproteobacteria bacterium]|nr:nitroreductase family protein [Deltaproteobacteria bacterium]
IGEVGAQECDPLAAERFSLAQIKQLSRSRRSIRVFKKELLPPGEIEQLVDFTRYAPAGHNNRDLRWLVVNGLEDVNRLSRLVIDWTKSVIQEQPGMAEMFHLDRLVKGWESGMDPICRQAPHLVMIIASKYNPLAQSAATIALSHLEIGAHCAGIGACWAGYLHIAVGSWEPLQKALLLEKNEVVYGAMMLGLPRYQYHRLPPRPQVKLSYL